MIHPQTELRYIDPVQGHGVFATQFIPRGTITWALDPFDQVLSRQRVAELLPIQRTHVEEYAYVDSQGNYILCWDLGRYVNHGCDPTSRGVGSRFEIAVRDIQAGEQLTSDYAELNITAAFACRCGSPKCRGVVRSDDLFRYEQSWDAVVAAALPFLERVPQPLWPFVANDEVLRLIRAGECPSRRSYYCPGLPQTNAEECPARRGLWRLTPASTS